MWVNFIIGFLLAMALSQLSVKRLAPKLYFNDKRIHHAHLGLFYLFIVLPIFLVAWAVNQINISAMMALIGLAVGVLVHDLLYHLFDKK